MKVLLMFARRYCCLPFLLLLVSCRTATPLAKPESTPAAQPHPSELSQEHKQLFTQRYASLIQYRVSRNWQRPGNVPRGTRCSVWVKQGQDGNVINVVPYDCNQNEVLRRSVEAAVQKASPLPRPEYAEVFDEHIILTFAIE